MTVLKRVKLLDLLSFSSLYLSFYSKEKPDMYILNEFERKVFTTNGNGNEGIKERKC